MSGETQAEDRHIIFFPENSMSESYADHIFWTETGGIGFSVGGHVVVKPFKEWHKLGAETATRSIHKAIAICDTDPAEKSQ